MKLLLISASNTITKKDQSASTKVCSLIKDYINKNDKSHDIDILPLLDKTLQPCMLCGECSHDGLCIQDDDFNDIYQKICTADKMILVVPHYSTIPSKLVMIFEKINEILYAGWIKNPAYTPKHHHISVGIIGHGGMTQTKESLKYYHLNLVTPISNTLRSLGFKIIKPSDEFPNGAVFGLENDQSIIVNKDHIFPDIIQNYDLILEQVKPLIDQMIVSI